MKKNIEDLKLTYHKNIEKVKPGTLITFIYGPGESAIPEFASQSGIAYGVKKSRWGSELRVKMSDCTFEYVSSLNHRDCGIGAFCWE